MTHPPSSVRFAQTPGEATYRAYWARHRPQFPPPLVDALAADESWCTLFVKWLLVIRRDRGMAKVVLYLSERRDPVDSLQACAHLLHTYIDQQGESDQIPWGSHQDWKEVVEAVDRGYETAVIVEFERCLHAYDKAATDLIKRTYQVDFWQEAVRIEESMTAAPASPRRRAKAQSQLASPPRRPVGHRAENPAETDYLQLWADAQPQFPPPVVELLAYDKTWCALFIQWLLVVRDDRRLATAVRYLSERRHPADSVDTVMRIFHTFIEQKDQPDAIPWDTHQDWRKLATSAGDSAKLATGEQLLRGYDRAATTMIKKRYQVDFCLAAVRYEESMAQPPTA